jgi:sulfite exporter TauE/SafE
MELAAVNSPAAAFVAGLVTSLHCAAMCGPLGCALVSGRAPAEAGGAASPAPDPQTLATAYQLSRLAGYTALGALAGGAGAVPLSLLGGGGLRWLPWALVAFFLAVALRLDRRLARVAVLARWQWRLRLALRGRSQLTGAALLGAATPLLPCGPLYFLVALAALTGSAARGAELMLAFGLGTLPLLWLAQANFGRLTKHLSPATVARAQTALALVTALVLAWRLRGTLGLGGPDAAAFLCTVP